MPPEQHQIVDAVDLVVLFLAIYHTVARLDVAKRVAGDHPQVAPEDFAAWRRSELGALGIVLGACFGYIVIDMGFKGLVFDLAWRWDPRLTQGFGLGLFGAWLAALGLGWYRLRAARRRRRELGIELR